MMLKKLNHVTRGEFLTVDEAAEYLGLKPTVIRNYLWEGKWTTYKFKTLTVLSAAELCEWKKCRAR